MILINETLENYAKEGRVLYNKLFLEPRIISHTRDAESYLKLHAQYTFISQLFNDIQLYNWRDEKACSEKLKEGLKL